MNMTHIASCNPEATLVVLEKTDLAISDLENLRQFMANSKILEDTTETTINNFLEHLKPQRNAFVKALDDYTRPPLLVLSNPERKGDSYKGKRIFGNPTDSFIQINTELINDHPDKLRSIQQAVRKGARNRKILSHDRNSLFVSKPEDRVREKSAYLGNGCTWT